VHGIVEEEVGVRGRPELVRVPGPVDLLGRVRDEREAGAVAGGIRKRP